MVNSRKPDIMRENKPRNNGNEVVVVFLSIGVDGEVCVWWGL